MSTSSRGRNSRAVRCFRHAPWAHSQSWARLRRPPGRARRRLSHSQAPGRPPRPPACRGRYERQPLRKQILAAAPSRASARTLIRARLALDALLGADISLVDGAAVLARLGGVDVVADSDRAAVSGIRGGRLQPAKSRCV